MSSDFTVVKYRKRNKFQKNFRRLTSNVIEDDCCKPLSEVLGVIESAKNEVNTSVYCTELLQSIKQQLSVKQLERQEVEILCYGLGHFSTNINARYQLGLLLNINNYLQSNVFIYDPVFSETELEILKSYNFNIISTNEKGKRKLSNKFTFVYLPHCPHWLVNNILWKNWGVKLNNCILFTNSFSEIYYNTPTDNLKAKFKYLYSLSNLNCVTEIKINNSFKFTDIFNSLSLHTFSLSKINDTIKEQFDLEEPFNCSDCEEDITDISEGFKSKINIR